MPSPTDLDATAELRLVPDFTGLGADALAALAALVTQRRVHAQLPLVEQGVPSPAMLVLVRGAAKVVRSAASSGAETVVLDVMRAPVILGDPSVVDGQPALASVITLRSSHVFALERRALSRLLGIHSQLARVLLHRYALEVRSLVRRVDEVVVGSVDERVKHLLESLALQHGTPLGQGRFIAIPLRRRDIACMVNATTETVSRLLAKFEREGLARSTRDGIWWRAPARPAPSAPTVHDAESPAAGPPSSTDANEPPSVALPTGRRS